MGFRAADIGARKRESAKAQDGEIRPCAIALSLTESVCISLLSLTFQASARLAGRAAAG